jgi:hypothetical protein
MAKVRGGCFCGAVRYEAQGEPSNKSICHCRSCRAFSSAPAVPWTTFERKGFRFTKGRPKTFKSSRPARRTFCASCGVPLTYVSAKWPATIDITTCSLDEPERFRPTHHSYVSHELSWMKAAHRLPKYAKFRSS